VGLSILLIGIDIGVTPIGNRMGASLTKLNKIWIIVTGGLILGFLICIAEPDLHILAEQVASVTSGTISKMSLIIVVSLGIGSLIALGMARIVYNIPLYIFLTAAYFFIFILSLFTSPEILAIAFDSSGATTGAMTVPFILSLALGTSTLKKDSKASEKDSFGLVGVASAGAIIAVLLMGLITRTRELTGVLAEETVKEQSIISSYFTILKESALDVLISLMPLIIIYLISQLILLKLNKAQFLRKLKGLFYTYIGMVIFLLGVNGGFMDVGTILGHKLSLMDSKFYIIFISLILGAVTILVEPSVYVLTDQIETVTSGYVKRKLVLIALSIGVGCAVALSILRILVPQIQLWHYLLPGYIISIGLSFFVPKLFVGIAFDSGGVASGTMCATVILAFAHGAAEAIETASVMADGFGIISMVALTPIITLQILGLIYKIKSRKGGLEINAEQE